MGRERLRGGGISQCFPNFPMNMPLICFPSCQTVQNQCWPSTPYQCSPVLMYSPWPNSSNSPIVLAMPQISSQQNQESGTPFEDVVTTRGSMAHPVSTAELPSGTKSPQKSFGSDVNKNINAPYYDTSLSTTSRFSLPAQLGNHLPQLNADGKELISPQDLAQRTINVEIVPAQGPIASVPIRTSRTSPHGTLPSTSSFSQRAKLPQLSADGKELISPKDLSQRTLYAEVPTQRPIASVPVRTSRSPPHATSLPSASRFSQQAKLPHLSANGRELISPKDLAQRTLNAEIVPAQDPIVSAPVRKSRKPPSFISDSPFQEPNFHSTRVPNESKFLSPMGDDADSFINETVENKVDMQRFLSGLMANLTQYASLNISHNAKLSELEKELYDVVHQLRLLEKAQRQSIPETKRLHKDIFIEGDRSDKSMVRLLKQYVEEIDKIIKHQEQADYFRQKLKDFCVKNPDVPKALMQQITQQPKPINNSQLSDTQALENDLNTQLEKIKRLKKPNPAYEALQASGFGQDEQQDLSAMSRLNTMQFPSIASEISNSSLSESQKDIRKHFKNLKRSYTRAKDQQDYMGEALKRKTFEQDEEERKKLEQMLNSYFQHRRNIVDHNLKFEEAKDKFLI